MFRYSILMRTLLAAVALLSATKSVATLGPPAITTPVVHWEHYATAPSGEAVTISTELVIARTPKEWNASVSYARTQLETAPASVKTHLVWATSDPAGRYQVEALNENGKAELKAASTSSLVYQDLGIKELEPSLQRLIVARPTIVATKANLPAAMATTEAIVGTGPEPRGEVADQRVLAVTRTFVAGVANSILIVASTGAETTLPAVAAAAAFFPLAEFGFQAFARQYADWLRRSETLRGRVAKRFVASVAIVTMHQFLLSQAALIDFDVVNMLKVATLGTIASHPWWEVVVMGRGNRFFSGPRVSFALGVAGSIGLALNTFGLPAGNILMGSIFASGAIVWSAKATMKIVKPQFQRMQNAIITRWPRLRSLVCTPLLRGWFGQPAYL